MCSVCTITWSQPMRKPPPARCAGPQPVRRPSHPSRPSESQLVRRARRAARGALVDTSIYLKPAELVDVALDVLARLAPCLNLGVGELGHKDLLDTIGADNCRK